MLIAGRMKSAEGMGAGAADFAEGAAGGRQGAVAAAGGAATAKAKIAIVLFMLLCSIS